MTPTEFKQTVYSRDELRNILRALLRTVQSTPSGTKQEITEAYQKGFENALCGVSLALGLGAEASANQRYMAYYTVEPAHIPFNATESTAIVTNEA